MKTICDFIARWMGAMVVLVAALALMVPASLAWIGTWVINPLLGLIMFGMGLTLRDGSREYFYRQLDRHFPGLKERYIREFKDRYEVPSPRSYELMRLFHHTCEQNGIMHDNDEIFAYLRQFEEKEPFGQLSLWQLTRNE